MTQTEHFTGGGVPHCLTLRQAKNTETIEEILEEMSTSD